MRTSEYQGDVTGLARSHPWSGAALDETLAYLDLRSTPSLIRTSLEDFTPWSRYPAVERFYELLEWLNGESSRLESNDCAFSAPVAQHSGATTALQIECSGRVMILFRDLALNLARERWDSFSHGLHRTLAQTDETFELGVIGTTLVPVRFRALLGPDARPREGQQLMLSFWAWGSTESECMANLGRVFGNLTCALQQLLVEA